MCYESNSSPSDSSDSESSNSDENIEGTGNITVAKRYLNRHSLSSEDLYTAPGCPHKTFRTSTPEPYERKPEKEPTRCPLKEIINHNRALHIPPVDIIVAPGWRATNAQEDSKIPYQTYKVPIWPLCKYCS